MSRLHPGTLKRTWMETRVVLYGFGPVLLAGTIQTVELSVLSLAAAVLLGLAGAAAKLSLNRPLRALATGYTTQHIDTDAKVFSKPYSIDDLLAELQIAVRVKRG